MYSLLQLYIYMEVISYHFGKKAIKIHFSDRAKENQHSWEIILFLF